MSTLVYSVALRFDNGIENFLNYLSSVTAKIILV
jgi:hypothetical protein